MSCKDRIERFGIKRGSGEPTVPVSSDHRNGDWIATDIYEGEMYQDTNTGIVYTRSGNNIVMPDGSTPYNRWTGIISQSGLVAPTLDAEINNTLGGTIAWSYLGVGFYRGTVTAAFPSQTAFVAQINIGSSTGNAWVQWETVNSFLVGAKDYTGLSVDGLLIFTQIDIKVY
jgi:hypothetical protein